MSTEIDVNKIAASLIEKAAEKVASKFASVGKDLLNKFKVDSSVAFRQYVVNAYERYSKTKTILYRDAPKPLSEFYECCELKHHKDVIESSDITILLGLSHFITIQGTGGIGKSTLLKYLFINELTKNDLIPVFIELKDLNDSQITLYDLMYTSLERFGFSLDKTYFEYSLKSGCFVLFFDGFDEIAGERYSEILKEFLYIADAYPENFYIASSRVNDNITGLNKFVNLHVIPFTLEKAVSLIKKIDYNSVIKNKFITALEGGLFLSHNSFASNPLLLTIMLMTYENYAEIPDKLHIFYSQAFDTLYKQHDANKDGYQRPMHCIIPYDCFVRILSKFCFVTYVNESFSFTYAELIKNLPKHGFLHPNYEPTLFIHDLINSVCIICQEGLKYQFTHRSFQEYFTALYIQSLTDDEQAKVGLFLIKQTATRVDDRVLDMWNDMAPNRFEKNTVIWILENIELESSRYTSKYDCYFAFLLDNTELDIDIDADDEDDEESANKLTLTYVRNSAPILSFLYHYLRRVNNKKYYFEKQELNHKIVELLGDKYKMGSMFRYAQSEKRLEICALLKESWIGSLVEHISVLLLELKKYESTNMTELDEILHI